MARIQSVNVIGLQIFAVGQDGIAEIKNDTVEWENKIDFIYSVFDEDGNLIKEIVNCPVVVTYDQAGSNPEYSALDTDL